MFDTEIPNTAELTYSGGRIERQYLLESLSEFFSDHLLTDVLFKVKGGKEANVYCCRAAPDVGLGLAGNLVAAKVYRPEAFRAMKNDGFYRIGREEVDAGGKARRDSRSARAMRKRTRIGRQMRSVSWIAHEYAALEDLVGVGCDVPTPIASGERTILMSFAGDEDGAAPTLHEAKLERREAEAALHGVLRNVKRMLEADRVHGDLSAYNVLWWRGRAIVIDLPQAVNVHEHPGAFELLVRDLSRVCDHFRRLGLETPDPVEHATKLWARR